MQARGTPWRRAQTRPQRRALRVAPRAVAAKPSPSPTSNDSGTTQNPSDNGNGKSGLPAPARAAPLARLAFLDEDGQVIKPMPADYGFRSGSGRLYQADYGTIPKNVAELSLQNFRRELRALRRSVRYGDPLAPGDATPRGLLRALGAAAAGAMRSVLSRLDAWLEENNLLNELTEAPLTQMEGELSEEQRQVLAQVRALSLDDSLVSARERARWAATGGSGASLPITAAYVSLCWVLDFLYAGRPIQRFWILETVARMPYFVYISMLHLYESLGWWRAGAELRKVHFAEEWNELHHLQIMEALGGDLRWIDRFVAEHAAVFYYWVLVVIYLISPSASYQFMEMVEGHAADTYAEFAAQNKEPMQAIPPPLVALNYYKSGDLYLFDEFQTSWKRTGGERRRPACNNLYDVFVNIRDDELEHVKTMVACQDGTVALDLQNTQAMAEFAAKQSIASLAPWTDSEDDAAAGAASAAGAANGGSAAPPEKDQEYQETGGSDDALPTALVDCRVLDTPAERAYDAITQLLCFVFKVNTPPYVRFYCGAPLISSEGQVLGSLAVLDIKPRTMPAGALRRAALRKIANLMCSFAEVVVRELEKDKVEKLRREKEEMHLPLVRALRCFDEPVALCDVALPGWPLKFVNSLWCQKLGASQDACLLSTGVWGFFHFAHNNDMAGMLYARAAIEDQKPFALRVAKGTGVVGSQGGAAPTPPQLWMLEFRPATSDNLGTGIPQIAIPSLVQLGFQNLAPGEERVNIPTYLYFVLMKPAEPPQQAERALERLSGSLPLAPVALPLPSPVRVQRPSAGDDREPPTPDASKEPSLHAQPSRRDGSGVGAPRDSSSGSVGMPGTPGTCSTPWSPRPFSQDQPDKLAEVTLGPLVGSGAHGKVHRGLWRGRKVAVKILDCITECNQDVRDTSAVGPALEATISKDLTHPNIVKTLLYAVHKERQEMPNGRLFQQIWLVEEYCNRGTLSDAIDRGWLRASPAVGAPINMAAVLRTAQDIASAMTYLHERSILHGDLTPGNVLLHAVLGDSCGFVVKVADFGISRVLSAAACRTATIGTVSHMPSELLEGGIVSHATDAYSFGVLLWEMYSSEHAWAGCRIAQIVHAKTMQRKRLRELPSDCPPAYKDLAERCLSDDAAERPTFPEIEAFLAGMLWKDSSLELYFTSLHVMKRHAGGLAGGLSPDSRWGDVQEWLRTIVFPHDDRSYERAAASLAAHGEEPDGEVLLSWSEAELLPLFGGNRSIARKEGQAEQQAQSDVEQRQSAVGALCSPGSGARKWCGRHV
ncbi:plastid terminal oxidase isoform B [Micractinium conductrix]|uniref:Ubiquinol oxidase n=1 Tax=Micractinium conductrix TaxID=554055 RepID=A0A2P6VEK9_9CHLO|nr:plastid terminal oxidase isoform B [Micractinium conductrix]|eukprot:PSC72507.1 plastid terminal oxidase isoform B [Micractinium conductrix]